tara:strand:- start:171 stop:440 length:270 start_codon:yes stop_codon:yes gene_type:complete
MILSNTETIPNKEITEICGIARGGTVRANHISNDIFTSFKHIIGGEIIEYSKLQAESREQALHRMTEDGERMRAVAIANVRLTASMVMQ